MRDLHIFEIGASRSYNLSKLNDFIFRSEASYHEPFILVLENVDDFSEGKTLWFQKCKYGLFSHLVKQPDHFLLLFVGKKKVGVGLQLFLIDNN